MEKVPGLTKRLSKQIVTIARQGPKGPYSLTKKKLALIGFLPVRRYPVTIFVNKERNLVVKIDPLICGKRPKRAVPTKVFKIKSRRVFGQFKVFVQPLVDTSRSAAARAMREVRACGYRNFGSDAYLKNVGIYKNKAVVFDW